MEHRYPNESVEYRQARDELAAEEAELIQRVKSVAKKRRTLPLACAEAGITTYVPNSRTSNNEARGLFGKRSFQYIVKVVSRRLGR